jgi:hypothetical protein
MMATEFDNLTTDSREEGPGAVIQNSYGEEGKKWF